MLPILNFIPTQDMCEIRYDRKQKFAYSFLLFTASNMTRFGPVLMLMILGFSAICEGTSVLKTESEEGKAIKLCYTIGAFPC